MNRCTTPIKKALPTYVNTPKANQQAALNFLNRELWNTPNWLMDPQLVSNFKSEGNLKNHFKTYNALHSIGFLSVKKLNRMLSTSQTLLGKSTER